MSPLVSAKQIKDPFPYILYPCILEFLDPHQHRKELHTLLSVSSIRTYLVERVLYRSVSILHRASQIAFVETTAHSPRLASLVHEYHYRLRSSMSDSGASVIDSAERLVDLSVRALRNMRNLRVLIFDFVCYAQCEPGFLSRLMEANASVSPDMTLPPCQRQSEHQHQSHICPSPSSNPFFPPPPIFPHLIQLDYYPVAGETCHFARFLHQHPTIRQIRIHRWDKRSPALSSMGFPLTASFLPALEYFQGPWEALEAWASLFQYRKVLRYSDRTTDTGTDTLSSSSSSPSSSSLESTSKDLHSHHNFLPSQIKKVRWLSDADPRPIQRCLESFGQTVKAFAYSKYLSASDLAQLVIHLKNVEVLELGIMTEKDQFAIILSQLPKLKRLILPLIIPPFRSSDDAIAYAKRLFEGCETLPENFRCIDVQKAPGQAVHNQKEMYHITRGEKDGKMVLDCSIMTFGEIQRDVW